MDIFWDGFYKAAFGSGAASGASYSRDHIRDHIDAIDEDSYFEGDMRTPTRDHYTISGSVDLDAEQDVAERAQDRKDHGEAVNAPKASYNHASSS